MVDLSALYRRLEVATFSQREQIAGEVVREVPRDELVSIVRGLEHPMPGVRLGVIEILRRAGIRESLRKLMQHARDRDGDERVFAMRALVSLAQPGDDFLAESVKGWMTSPDPFVAAQAEKLASILARRRIRPPTAPVLAASGAGAPGAAAPSAAVPGESAPGESLDKLVLRLFSATKGTERIALVEAIERRGPQAFAGAAKLTLQKGNADLVAYMARAVIRQEAVVPEPDKLQAALEAARARLGDAPIARAAIDDALLALGGASLSPVLLGRLGELEPAQLEALARRLVERPPGEVALHAPAMLDAIARAPAMWAALGPVLAHIAPQVREGARDELRKQTERVLDSIRRGEPVPPATAVSACWVLARTAERGEPLPRQLRTMLERVAGADAARALCALYARLATEDAAAALIAMLRDPLPDVRAGARAALGAWQSPWIRIDGLDRLDEGAAPAIVHTYENARGEPLVRRGERLVAATGDEEYVLDARGRPIRGGETEYGGCLCCAPPRVLVRRHREGLRCPSTWESHLRDGTQTMLERDHPLGRCKRCDSVRPRAKDGKRAVCFDCRAGIATDDGSMMPGVPGEPGEPPPVPSEHGRRGRPDALPKPPTREELEHVAPQIRAAILANVFLHADSGHQTWNGSGVVIARDGHRVAILTNRHVVETDDTRRLCDVTALAVSGEPIPVSTVWRGKRGVDLALVEGVLRSPESLGVMPLGSGAGLVGAEVFAIGNPLGLAWSYSAGTLSAVRHWTTHEGESVRIFQTDANVAPGSSGGGLFHSAGHLLGIVSFLRQGPSGGSAHFALSIDAIRQAFQRENVRWHGRALAELP